jgi:hypothetical protein
MAHPFWAFFYILPSTLVVLSVGWSRKPQLQFYGQLPTVVVHPLHYPQVNGKVYLVFYILQQPFLGL